MDKKNLSQPLHKRALAPHDLAHDPPLDQRLAPAEGRVPSHGNGTGFQPRLTPGPRRARTDAITAAVQRVVDAYATALNGPGAIRSVNIDVKFKNDGSGIRTVLISIQGETELTFDGG